jgi:methyl-accepting chemotaxis protein
MLISMEAQRLAFELAVAPESVRLIDSIGRIGSAAQTTSALAADLPALLARERAETIDQLTGILDERQGQLQALVVELRTALEAGGIASDSVRDTIAALDALMMRFQRPAARTGGLPSRPFDVTEYTEALRELGATATQLQALIAQADSKAPAITQLSDRAADRMAAVVDRAYWRLVQLVLVLVAATVVGALAYRAIARRS